MTARIVSLVPSLTELLCELGLADQLVGRTGFCIHPKPVVAAIPKVGGTKSVDVDKLRALAPTHVVVNVDENERDTVERIAQFVPNVLVTHPLRVEDNLALYRRFGRVFGCEAQADALSQRLQQALQRVRAHRWPPQRVLYLIWKRPWMTVSRDTYIADVLAQVGWQAVAPPSAARYPEIDWSRFDDRDCDWVLFSSEPYRFRDADRSAYAAERGRDPRTCVAIDGEMTSWYGSRAIEGLDYLARYREQLERQS
jgi:ABC-type Fe3+-hydroxamate transport system substrate-binding protein